MLAILKELCAENNTNFSRVEKAIGIGNGQLARWGKSSPSIESASKVADFFNVSLDYLAGRETPEPKLTADETELLQLFRQMSDKERQRLIGRAETIVEQEKENAKLLTSKVG